LRVQCYKLLFIIIHEVGRLFDHRLDLIALRYYFYLSVQWQDQPFCMLTGSKDGYIKLVKPFITSEYSLYIAKSISNQARKNP
jgi:hypothetical protein